MIKHGERGSALVYILIAIALLAALTASFMDSSSQQTSSQSTFNATTELNSQINFVRSSIQECVLTYPTGDADAISASAQVNNPYPIQPDETYFSTATIGSTADSLVKDIRCPGNPGGGDENHEKLFQGRTGKFMPPAPNLFNDWEYYNGDDGVFFWTSTSFTDAFLTAAIDKVADQMDECEVDVLTTSGSDVDMASETSGIRDASCVYDTGNTRDTTCLRIWVIRESASDVPDEAACN